MKSAAIRILSLGWGTQSWGLAAMSALGILPKVDFAVHADTGWERRETIEFAARWTPWLEERGIEVVTVKSPFVEMSPLDRKWVTPPFFTRGPKGDGMLYRTCTDRWKVRPMQKWQRGELERRGLKKSQGVIEKWLGFTLDEAHRANDYGPKYVRKVYPFLEMLERPYTRGMVIQWLEKEGLEVPVKSSCIICPFHGYQQWREIQLADNGDWERAVEVDRAIRHKRPGFLCYLASDRKPLEDHNFTAQMSLW